MNLLVNVGLNCPLISSPPVRSTYCSQNGGLHLGTPVKSLPETPGFYQNTVPNLYGALKGPAQSA